MKIFYSFYIYVSRGSQEPNQEFLIQTNKVVIIFIYMSSKNHLYYKKPFFNGQFSI